MIRGFKRDKRDKKDFFERGMKRYVEVDPGSGVGWVERVWGFLKRHWPLEGTENWDILEDWNGEGCEMVGRIGGKGGWMGVESCEEGEQ